jgi:endonuclease/exonuclease/phosphatase family metal-dependent hydrolase
MPCKGYKSSLTEYAATLDEIHEIISKYAPRYHILLAGDLNAQTHNGKKDPQDMLLQTFCEEVSLVKSQNYPQSPTFTRANGVESTQIDHILATPHMANLISKIEILNSLDLNTSGHHPVTATCMLSVRTHVRSAFPITNKEKEASNKVK